MKQSFEVWVSRDRVDPMGQDIYFHENEPDFDEEFGVYSSKRGDALNLPASFGRHLGLEPGTYQRVRITIEALPEGEE